MKRKLIAAFLLACCFVWLGFLSGAIPTSAEAEATSAEIPPAPSPSGTPIPTDPVVADILESPSPTINSEPSVDATPFPTTSPSGLSVIATTITGDSLLDNNTYYEISPEELLADEFILPLAADGYQILILHTHTTEAYTPTEEESYEADDEYRTTDPDHSVIRVGEALAAALEAYGLHVLHDTNIYDHPSYNGSYVRSGEAVEEYLAAYPGIKLVIDLHRDALGDDDVMYKTLADIDGLEAAQLMFVMGTDINLENPAWRDNLTLALTLHEAVAARYPTLMRPTVLCSSRYNQQLCPGSLLLEVGTSGNTLEEALTGVELFAQIVGPILASWVE